MLKGRHMQESILRHRTRSRHITTAWGAIHHCLQCDGYQALGRRPGADEPWRPDVFTAYGATPIFAYHELVRMTGCPWNITMLESEFEAMAYEEQCLFSSFIGKLRLISPFFHAWGQSIWAEGTSPPGRALGAWLAFVAAQNDELVVQELS